ncbi:AAA family ATPase [Candidatus Endomicrobiellum agilis]|uniref:cytidylate kinase-like family protein n=1 Tax=Candidatus Endomicrobiellum agilis TaxID=3238957 RepID=UPI00357A3533|nr:cytidylate kinase-like family protein [Endomicrobium sp.]
MNKKFAITIARQYGSGGFLIGKKLSKDLNIAFYDKELIKIASEKSGLEKELFEASDEKKHFWLFGGLHGLFVNFFGLEQSDNNLILNDSLFKIQSDIIKQLARKESSVFIGRCANYVLRNHPKCINVFICADIEDRIERISLYKNITENKALEEIERSDRERSKYYNYYTGKVWEEAISYHLCINSSVLGIDKTAEFIRTLVEKKFK